MSELSDLARETTICPFCRALPGEECRTRTGRTSQFLHGDRQRPVVRAWSRGYTEGMDEVVEILTGGNMAARERLMREWLRRRHRATPWGCSCGEPWPNPLPNNDTMLAHEIHLEEVRS